ncbi:NUDIX domain-containing protein [Candidatus Woesearchaeota archaeon]|nr:NUDIX domain-containing protein [Candidatus Woesearchaeota archaeon]
MKVSRETDVNRILDEFSGKLPQFPDGRIDYSESLRAPVITCFVRFKDKVLLLKRSDNVGAYRGKWNAVAGYIDEAKPLSMKVMDELKEELGILHDDILRIEFGAPYEFYDLGIERTWIIYPCVADLRNNRKIRLDWEHTAFKWIYPDEIFDYDIVPRLDESLNRVLG